MYWLPNNHRKPCAVFADTMEDGAMEQLMETLQQHFVRQVAIMPDVHQGYTLPIGAVVAVSDHVVPSYVGYDIGCGMLAVPTNFDAKAVRKNARHIHAGILRRVPVGREVFMPEEEVWPNVLNDCQLSPWGREAFHNRKGWRHMGTLGGGNHFIEVGEGKLGQVWIIVHSGSRGVGHGVASTWMAVAAHQEKPTEGHYAMHVESATGKAYINDMEWMLKFASANRERIATEVTWAIREHCYGGAEMYLSINKCHNFAAYENGQWVHRKGATPAFEEMPGVIPGNMLDGTCIVRGCGNKSALNSSSHGAGRRLGRKAAKRELDLESYIASMGGVVGRFDESTLDEAPGAYKDFKEVIDAQVRAGMLQVVDRVRPILNVKG